MKKLKIDLPQISKKRIALRVTSAAERAIRSGHPWVFENAIVHQSHQGKSGDLAVIFDKKRHFLAIGLYDPDSMIRVRILRALKPATVDKHFFAEKLDSAHQRRAPLRDSDHTNGYRLLHGENDGMPGLVIDRYAETAVIKLYTPTWIPHLSAILDVLEEDFPAKRIVLRLSDRLKESNHGLHDGMFLLGEKPKSPITFQENGLKFEVDPLRGQKTGFFLDQRENRARVEKLAKGKSVLNVFSYTGGFSVYAARGGAKQIVSLDASKPAIKAARKNFSLNFKETHLHEGIVGDAFEIMAQMKKEGRLFKMVVIDPPSFAHKQSQTDGAIKAYKKLTRLGLGILAANGILVQASCSSRVDSDLFFNSINIAAHQAGRMLKEIERSNHALDHPIEFPEGEYLKCLFALAP
ncbi:MAG: 23S rRNA (cytosine(2499)-C(5))-methyltransferase [Anaerolineae bacterium]|jgi:23S rRNA (cytosine1962-C5)-methyltransferase|nr:23S rRNA (cytosine(2499)-C(5))-methyltransferase [Anaerolineae bacterium]